MRKTTRVFTLLVLIACTAAAQTPTFYNYNVAGTGNAFPFGTTATRKVQWRILANSLGTVTPGNNITVVYFMTGNASSNTYPLINISLKQGPAQFAGGGNFETGMTRTAIAMHFLLTIASSPAGILLLILPNGHRQVRHHLIFVVPALATQPPALSHPIYGKGRLL
jgi:hypothetical protein